MVKRGAMSCHMVLVRVRRKVDSPRRASNARAPAVMTTTTIRPVWLTCPM
jgi:hypothetical protein